MDFIDRRHRANKPFFVWFASTRMHIQTHLKTAPRGKTGMGGGFTPTAWSNMTGR